MKKTVFLFGILLMIVPFMLFTQEFTHVGAAKCKVCHKSTKSGNQYGLWEGQKHSKSFAALSTDDAKALAADAPDNSECLKCHSPLAEKAPELKEEGVTCEVCHGPGSAYKKLSIMKDQAEAVKNGLILYGSADAIKARCLTCHEKAHDKPFDFDTAWEKVKHPVPEEK